MFHLADVEDTAEQAGDGPPVDEFGRVPGRWTWLEVNRGQWERDDSRHLIIRLALSFATLIVGMLVLGWWVSSRTLSADVELQKILKGRPEKLRLADQAMRLSSENTRISLQLLSENKPAPELLANRLRNTERIDENIVALEKLCDSSQEKDLLAAVQRARSRYIKIRACALDLLLKQHDRAHAYRLMIEQGIPALAISHTAWEEFFGFELRAMEQGAEQNSARKRATRRIGLTLQSLSALFAAFIAVFTTREMAKNLELQARMQVRLRRLNAGLEQRVAERTEELKGAERRLRESLSQLREYAGEIEAVNELTKLLQSCLTLEEARQQTSRMLQKFYPAGAVLLLNSSRNLLEVAFSWGESSSAHGPFPPESCWGLRKGEVHVAGPHCNNPICSHCETSPDICHVCIPMVAQGTPLGALSIDDRSFCDGNPKAAGRTRKLKLATTLAEQISLAFANLGLRETLKYQSVRDPLTGLFNRRYMEEGLERELRRAARKSTPVAVMMIDIDDFKRFNDAYGHEAGDLVLREFGMLLRLQVRGGDLACRYGGEEFLLIMGETDLESACKRGETLRQRIAALPIRYHGHTLRAITVSIGIAMFPAHGSSPEQLVSAADTALYRAKREGRDQVLVAE